MNTLFTSAGRRVELLRAFQQAYASLDINGQVIALDIDALAPAVAQGNRHYIVPRVTDPAYIPTLVEICRTEAVSIVFPLIDPDIAVLAAHRAEIEATGARLAVVSPEAAALTGDKWLT